MNPSFFHQKCNNIPQTVSIVKTSKGYKFGWYTEKTWENSNDGVWIKDDKSFVFSINYMKIYNHIEGTSAILHNDNYGTNFYCCIYLQPDFSNNQNCTCKKDVNQYFQGFNRDYELNDGKQNFSLDEIEVFQVILE